MIAEHVLTQELKVLPRFSRAQLARELLDSLDEPEQVNFINLLWGEEAERRLTNITSGVTKTIQGQQVLAEARRCVNA